MGNNVYKSVELGKEFATQKELFKALKANKKEILRVKRKQIVTDKVVTMPLKAATTIKNLDSGYVYPVVSVTNLYDSHKDVHFKGCFNKTLKEQQGKVVYALDHYLEVEKIIAWEDDVEMQLMNFKMSDLGYHNDEREVEGLVYKIKEDVLMNCGKKAIKNIIENRKPVKNSIRMVYFKINLGINDNSEEFKEEYEYYQKRINDVYNREEVEKEGYFFGVEELGIKDEASMVVKPSQSAAITLYSEPSADTQLNDAANIEPFKDTQKGKEPKKETINLNLF